MVQVEGATAFANALAIVIALQNASVSSTGPPICPFMKQI